MEEITGRDFYNYRNLPPAYAGLVTDWKIGAREITSTILDLISRGNIAVVGDSLILNAWPARNFEQKFIKVIFGNSHSLKISQIAESAYKIHQKELLRIIAQGLMEEGYVNKDFQKQMVHELKSRIADMGFQQRTHTRYAGAVKLKPIELAPWKIWAGAIVIFIVVVFFLIFYINIGMIMVWALVPFVIAFFIVHKIHKNFASRMENRYGESLNWILTSEGKELKEKASFLRSYMMKYPLAEDRLANELVGHAVAFGLGKEWMKRLGKVNADIMLFFESLGEGDAMSFMINYEEYMKEFDD